MPEPKELEMKKPETREWTVMFCFASDNPLAPGTISQLKAIKDAGYHPEVNVIAQFDPHTVNMPVHIFNVNQVAKLYDPEPNIGYATDGSFVRNLVLDKLWDDDVKKQIQEMLKAEKATSHHNGHRNHGNEPKYDPPVPTVTMSREQNPKETLAAFLNFCRINYPARHYMLFILAHGVVVGNDIFMFDEHGATENGESSPRSLLLTDLGDVLDKFNDKIKGDKDPGKLELIGFHSCSMSGAEVAFELKGKANYMLASQGPLFVGAWPYRQILIRLFRELGPNAPWIDDSSIASGLIDKLKTGCDSTSAYLRSCLNGSAGKLLNRHRVGSALSEKLVKGIVEEFQRVSSDRKFCEHEAFNNGSLTAETRRLRNKHKRTPLRDHELRRLNRRLIMESYPEEMKQVRIRRMLINIFDYCVYNSFDFQLAGYSCDLTLCDLNKVHRLQEPLATLADALSKGLANPSAREAMLLAHWEAQSFYEEKYSDLYDFCLRLKRKCPDSRNILKNISRACDDVMEVLKRGFKEEDYGAIVRSEFCGPMYQYSHGLSIFFPWSEPVGNRMWDREYEQYELNQRTGWKNFLKGYFDATMRCTQVEENDPRDERWQPRQSIDTHLLDVLQHVATRVLSDDEQLKGGSRDPLGKGGSRDPAGSDCECGSIKNYPPVTRRSVTEEEQVTRDRRGRGQTYPAFASPMVFDEVKRQLTGKTTQERPSKP